MASLADLVRILQPREERHAATARIADHVRLVEPEMIDQRADVVGRRVEADWPVDVGGPAVALKVGGDDLVVRRERPNVRAERLARPEAAVEQDQRPAGAMRLDYMLRPLTAA